MIPAEKDLSEIQISYRNKVRPSERRKISCSRDGYEAFMAVCENIEYRESFYVMCLNRANKILGFSQISSGGLSGTVADPKIIFQVALKANASSVILCHNHPSGNTQPSEADIKLTQKIKSAGAFLELPVLDQLIITSESYYSFADEGML